MTDLTTILSYLPSDKIKDLETITQRIIDLGGAEIIILFGSYARGDYKEQRGENKGKKSDYDIFVVTSNSENRNKLRSELREIFKDIGVSVQLIVEQISFVNDHLEEMQYFFTDIKREGKILFDSGKYELSNSKELTPIRRREIAEEDFEMWFGTAKKIMDSIRVDYKLAAFDLQQVAEMCYTAIEMVFTHYNPYEHNLEVLRNRVLLFDSRVNDTLPSETEEQQELFDYLNFAYIGGRYRSEKEFPVTKEQLNYWHKEVKELFVMTEIICKERIEGLKKIEHEYK
jgi:predicted nucleotidyltransferase